MLLLLRASRAGRFALALAAALVVCTSFGLHPEPRGIPAAASHGCPACLAHRVAELSAGAPTLPAPSLLLAPLPAAPEALIALHRERPREGRAPPRSS